MAEKPTLFGMQDDSNAENQDNINGEALEDTAPKRTAAEKVGEIGQDAKKNAVDAVKKNGTNLKGAATDVVAKTASDTAKKAVGDVSPEAAEAAGKAADTVARGGSAIVAAKGAIAGISQAVSAAVALLIDPITWIVIGVVAIIVVLIIGIVAGVQVFGKTENADGCYGIGMYGTGGMSGGGATSINVEASADKNATAATIADWAMTTIFKAFGGKPMSREQAVGLIGNAWQESQMNPAASQSSSISANSSNADVMALGKKNGGKAIGIIQWDSDRRYYFAQYAESRGKHWSDLGVQLEFMFLEIEGTADYPDGAYSHGLLVKSGFPKAGESVEFYTEKWEKSFTRAGKPQLDKRINYANTFNAQYKPGSGVAFSSASSGGSCLTAGGVGAVDTSSTVNLAVSIAYPTVEESRTGGDQLGTSKAKPEYVEAKKKAEEIAGKDGIANLYASCDRAVATVVINTMDPKYPWGNIVTQRKYADANPNKWKKYTSLSEAKPGDVWITQPQHDGGGHTVMYLGTINGQDMIMHASYSQRGNSRVAAIQPRASYISDAMTDKSGRSYFGYTYVGG